MKRPAAPRIKPEMTRHAHAHAALLAANLVACSTPTADVGGFSGTSTESTGAASETSAIGGPGTTTDASWDSSITSAPDTSSEGNADGGPVLDVGSAESGGVADDCAEGNDLIVVLFEDEDNVFTAPELHQFDPITGTFTLRAVVECAFNEETGFYPQLAGLAVDRQGRALMHDSVRGEMLSIDIADPASCTWLDYVAPPVGLVVPGSMAYVVLEPDDPASERMFVGDGDGGGLGWAEVGDSSVVGTLLGDTPFNLTLVAGTGDGRLFAIGYDNDDTIPVDLVELDPDDGTVLETFLNWPTVPFPAFYAGDLLMVDRGTQQGPDYVSSVWLYDLDDDDGNGEHDVILVANEAAFPIDKIPTAVASPTCIPTTPAG